MSEMERDASLMHCIDGTFSDLSISQHFNGPISGGKNALNSCSQQLLNHVVVVEVATVVVVWKKNSVRAWNDLAMNLQRALVVVSCMAEYHAVPSSITCTRGVASHLP